MKLFIFFFCLFIVSPFSVVSQKKVSPNGYLLFFTDKNSTRYSTNKPEDFLSDKSIDRRLKSSISITDQDLPVNQKYVDSLRTLGLRIHQISKWFNAVCVFTDDTLLIDTISRLSFIRKEVDYSTFAKDRTKTFDSLLHTFGISSISSAEVSSVSRTDNMTDNDWFENKTKNGQGLNYGIGSTQISMLNGHALHDEGFLGQGVDIAILDGGFWNMDKLSVSNYVFENKRVKYTYDFVDNDTVCFDINSHGTKVWSVIGSNLSGTMIGAAPEANFYLFRTEDDSSEFPIEEFNWLVAAEVADSLGVDIISSSLGYADYDDESMSYSYADLDGKTAMISLAATIASQKGMLVVTSVGNEGNKAWRYLTVPADSPDVLSVGAVKADSSRVNFSSYGPTADGRIKPDVMAMGYNTVLVDQKGEVVESSGTSFACPVIAGLAACLWQAHPDFTNYQLITAIKKSADKFQKPDTACGFGLPDFYLALHAPDTISSVVADTDNVVSVYPNPFSDLLNVDVYSNREHDVTIELFDLLGALRFRTSGRAYYRSYKRFYLEFPESMSRGIYIIRVFSNDKVHTSKILKL